MRRIKPLTLDTLLEKQVIPFNRDGSREDQESFIVGGAMPGGIKSPKRTMQGVMKNSSNNPGMESARKALKNKAQSRHYRNDPRNR